MGFKEVLEELQKRKSKALGMGGPEKLAARRAQGFLNARERIDYLLDEGSFIESGLFATSIREEVRDKAHGDGKLAGYGTIDGKLVALVSNDFTVLGASSSSINLKKMRHMKKVAIKRGIPLVLLGESTGARMPDRMGAAGRATMGQDPTEFRRLREVPMISAMLGECYGSSTWYTCISDFTVMRKGAHMAVASGRVASIAISQEVDAEELGGWKLHSEVTGLVDVVVDKDEEALDVIKKFLSYMPSNSQERPAHKPVPDGSEDGGDKILDIIPDTSNRVYDMMKIIQCLVDKDSVFELKKRFGRSIITTLARLNGHVVGIIANNPIVKGGSIEVDAMRKATSFIVLCDSFNIPLIFLVDQPGFLIGLEAERRAAPGRIMNWMNAVQLCTVPKISIIVRKDYGQAYLNMGGGQNSDEVLLWPFADLGFMDPAVGVKVLFNLTKADDPQKYEEAIARISRDTSAWDLAGLYEGQMVIDPRETRAALKGLLKVHLSGPGKGIGQHQLCNWPTSY